MKILSVSVTGRGRAMAEQLPWEHRHGDAARTVGACWGEVDALVLFVATGAAVRIIAPLLTGKHRDPAVVCVDEAGRFAVALCGGHGGGANDLARSVAELLGAQPVVTTASDSLGRAGLDTLPGFVADGDLASASRALLDGDTLSVHNPLDWPLPGCLIGVGRPPSDTTAVEVANGPQIVVTDLAVPGAPRLAILHPPSLVAGIGSSSTAIADEVEKLVDQALRSAGLSRASVGLVATIERRREAKVLVALGLPIRAYPESQLAEVEVPNPSEGVRAAVGTSSVCEAAALLAAGPDATLVVEKQTGPTATVAIARRRAPQGHVSVVGLGPGNAEHRTPAAERAVRRAEVVIGYAGYVELSKSLLQPGQRCVNSPIGDEVGRARQALAEAGAGRRVAVVCSGDAGVYAMASIVLELADASVEVEVIPGVTAALASAAVVGAPLGHDHCAISLSDLLTDWDAIAERLGAAGRADLVVSLYNPRSARRTWQFEEALRILGGYRRPDTPVGIVTDAGRQREHAVVTTLDAVDPGMVGMTTCVIVGSTTTRIVNGRMVTPRGYR